MRRMSSSGPGLICGRSRGRTSVWTYGVLPRELFEALQARLRGVLDQRRVARAD